MSTPPPQPKLTPNEIALAATQAPIFGPLVGPWTIERAAVATLTKWLFPTYIQAIEDQHGLKRGKLPQPGGIFGASDTTQWDQGLSPGIMVVCDTASGAPERYESIGYSQAFTLIIAAIVQDDNPSVARMNAALYATAAMGVIGQQLASDDLANEDPIISHVEMTGAPDTNPPDEEIETIVLGQVTFQITAAPILVDTAGPDQPVPLEGEASPWPVVTTVSEPGVTVTAEDLPTS